jgi:NO-binding membrane sensor protein with MHYT domain
MGHKDTLTKILALAGTVLVWFPILAPVLLTAILYLQQGIFRLDYLMPAELFLVAIAGSALLLWASRQARSQPRLIRGGIVLAVVMIVGGQAIASFTGLASGEIEPQGWPWALVTASLAVYVLALGAIGVGGILLLRDLFKPAGSPTPSH